jgi:RHS repeat-associated protein
VVLRGAGQVNGITNRYEYQNKESEKTFGLNRINLGARTYNPTIGRMDGVDAMSDLMRRHSPYQANFNNPLRFIDPDGNEAKEVQDFTYTDGYGTYSSRNSSGSISFSGAYHNNYKDSEPPIELQFDQNGNYIGSVDDGKKEYSGAIIDSKGNKVHFELNDQRDAEGIVNGTLSLNLSFSKNFNLFLKKAGVEPMSIFSRFPYALRQSLYHGKIDFVQHIASTDTYADKKLYFSPKATNSMPVSIITQASGIAGCFSINMIIEGD